MLLIRHLLKFFNFICLVLRFIHIIVFFVCLISSIYFSVKHQLLYAYTGDFADESLFLEFARLMREGSDRQIAAYFVRNHIPLIDFLDDNAHNIFTEEEHDRIYAELRGSWHEYMVRYTKLGEMFREATANYPGRYNYGHFVLFLRGAFLPPGSAF